MLLRSCVVRVLVAFALLMSSLIACGADFQEIRSRGELRHLGIRYANFVTGSWGDSVEQVLLGQYICARLAQLLDEQFFDAVAVCEALCKQLAGTEYAGRFDGMAESLIRLDCPGARSALKAASNALLSEADEGGGSLA